jgi:transposase-like protein
MEQIGEGGMAYLPELIRTLVNGAMQVERQKHLGVGPYERTPERQGYANGNKSKMVQTRVGSITFDIPQVQEGDFYPGALEKGLRNERVLTMAACMFYAQ